MDAKSHHKLHLFDFSPLCVFKLPVWERHNHIGCICLTFLRYVFSNGLPEMRQSHIDFGFSPLCVFISVLKLRVCENAKSLGCHLFDFSTLYVFKCLRKWPATEDAYCIVTLVAFVWFFCTVYFQMLTGKVILVAFVWRFQMSPQMACPRTCLIKNTDFQNFHVCGKNQTCVGIAKLSCVWFLPHMCGFYQIPKTCQGVW